jgi:ectoine hydroxylase-related dioxygenase (phytanoyl-CoA dioxygenase family)
MLIDQLSDVAATVDSEEIRARYDENGYLVVRGLFDPAEDLQPTIDEYSELVDRLAKEWYAAGELSSDYAGLPLDERLIEIMAETGDRIYSHLRIFFNPPSGTTPDSPIHYGPAIFGLLTNPKLLDVVEVLLGPEITVNPVNNVRVKPPERRLPKGPNYNAGTTATFWHQDQGVYADDISEYNILTVWIPLTDARADMGCLQVVPGSHRGELVLHCTSEQQSTHGIPQLLLGPVRHNVEMKAGDVHFHHQLLQHSALPNLSNQLRFSFDLRYQPTEEALGQSLGVPERTLVPGFVARSRLHPERELTDWRQWVDYQEDMRRQFMAIDWENAPVASQFVKDHPYCL